MWERHTGIVDFECPECKQITTGEALKTLPDNRTKGTSFIKLFLCGHKADLITDNVIRHWRSI